MRKRVITVRLPPGVVAALDRAAEERRVSRAEVVRRACLQGDPATLAEAARSATSEDETMPRVRLRFAPDAVQALDQAAAARSVKRAELIRGALVLLYPGEPSDCRPRPDVCAPAAVSACCKRPRPEFPTLFLMHRRPAPQPSLRERIVTVMSAEPDAVFTPARLAPGTGWRKRDSIRNTLLVLAAKAKIEKVGPGKYRWSRPDLEAGAS